MVSDAMHVRCLMGAHADQGPLRSRDDRLQRGDVTDEGTPEPTDETGEALSGSIPIGTM
jgi:hypothetical protein